MQVNMSAHDRNLIPALDSYCERDEKRQYFRESENPFRSLISMPLLAGERGLPLPVISKAGL
jgi:hypothetical protein